jgi:hypothetical protein
MASLPHHLLFVFRTALAYCLPVLPTGLARWFLMAHGDVKPFATSQAQMVIKSFFTLAGAIDVLVFWIVRKKTGAFFFQRTSEIRSWNTGSAIELGCAVSQTGSAIEPEFAVSQTGSAIGPECAVSQTGESNDTQNPAITPLSRFQKVIHKIESFVRTHREC